jgi:hypothetical protein
MKKFEISIFAILYVILSIWLTSSLAHADTVIDDFFEATDTFEIGDAGKDGEILGVTNFGLKEFIVLASIYVISKEHYELSQEWDIFEGNSYCFSFWAGVKEYGVCVKDRGSNRFVVIDRIF